MGVTITPSVSLTLHIHPFVPTHEILQFRGARWEGNHFLNVILDIAS